LAISVINREQLPWLKGPAWKSPRARVLPLVLCRTASSFDDSGRQSWVCVGLINHIVWPMILLFFHLCLLLHHFL